MVIQTKLIEELPVSNELGEGIQWRGSDQTVWWTDILGCTLYRLEWPTKKLTSYEMPEPLGSFAFTDSHEVIIAGFATGFAFYDLEKRALQWLHRLKFLTGEGRLNDGRADRQGRFWCGSMMARPDVETHASGRLFSVDSELILTSHLEGINISNGLCWSPDGQIMYFADSLPGKIYQFDFNTADGSLANKRIFAEALEGGSPDGATVDAAGNVWSAHWGLGKVICFDIMGDIVAEVSIPTSQPSCVAFGGKNLDLLFVTSAKEGMLEKQLADEPSAGNVFVYETSVTGLIEPRYCTSQRVR
ncbi:SMP-30/gluconolactonase/LRE family protein [Kordiimonas aquimaris]|uniref:SMP-30/gluconolactonase/LRE family protein n=1 Tax=Kordiimonas aquimaris TaxID=707591 RepID=UPI0021D28175|nr:SMP-30/gluconolactonase/LRE family protein [Kordiimonas aquimaris]